MPSPADPIYRKAFYEAMAAKLKPKGSNYTPPKKKRKKRK
jgi:hypothetical protein